MAHELADEGHEVHIVAINAANAVDNQRDLAEVCTFPLLQDTEAVDAWGLLGGEKDDFFVLDADGVQAAHLSAHGDLITDLSTPEGYANVKAAVLAAE